MNVHDFLTAPAVVVGGGIAGLSTALALERCVVVANEPVGGGASQHSQGGIAAAISAGDSPALHAADTLRVAAGLADPDIVALVTQAAAGRIAWLREMGVAFDSEPSGALALGREAGHCRPRIVHAGGDRTGAAVMQALREAVLRHPDIRVLEGFTLLDIVSSGDRAAGVLLEGPGGLRLAVSAPQVVLATGGIGGCFERTTNPVSSRGAGLAAAARSGVRLANLEFVQFHPTALAVDADPLPLLTEALRGAGAVLLDDSGRRFMTTLHPDAELAPRDVVARGVFAITSKGRRAFLDATAVPDLAARFPGACAIARDAGFDAARQLLPVVPAAHFHMGGIATDSHGATSMPGLWACGEVAATGLHGGNRLASNSLLEGLVFGEAIASAIGASALPPVRGLLEVPRGAAAAGSINLAAASEHIDRVAALRRIIGEGLGPLRSAVPMLTTLRKIDAWTPASRSEFDFVLVARELLRAALRRKESRGAHQRSDYPEPAHGAAARHFVTLVPTPVETLELRRMRVA